MSLVKKLHTLMAAAPTQSSSAPYSFSAAQAKYSKRTGGLIPALFDQIIASHATLAAHARQARAQSVGTESDKMDFASTVLGGRKLLNVKNNFLRATSEFVETRFALAAEEKTLVLSLGDGDNRETLRLLKTLLPDFKLPTQWVYDSAMSGGRSVKGFLPPEEFLTTPVKKLVPLKTLQKLAPIFPPGWEGPKSYLFQPFFDGLEFEGDGTRKKMGERASSSVAGASGRKSPNREKAFGAGFEDRLYLSLSLDGMYVKVNPDSEFMMNIPQAGDTYDFDPMRDSWDGSAFLWMDLQFTAHGSIRWPLDFAYYSTASQNERSFIPALFHSVVATNRARIAKSTSYGRPVKRLVAHISNFEDLERTAKLAPFPKKLRVNEDGFLILGSAAGGRMGDVAWVPMANNVAPYIEFLRKSYDPDTFSIKTSLSMASMPLYTDPFTEKFSFINEAGSIDVLNLDGSIPLNDLTIHLVLSDTTLGSKSTNQDAASYRGWKLRMQEALSLMAEKIGYSGTEDGIVLRRAITALASSSNIYEYLSQYPEDAADLAAVCQRVLDSDFKFTNGAGEQSHVPYAYVVLKTRFAAVLFSKYAPQRERYQKAAQEAELIYSDAFVRDRDFDEDCVVVNLPGVSKLLPHQIKMQKRLQPQMVGGKPLYSETTIVSAGVGSGKSLAGAIMTIAAHIYRGTSKRPLIVLPNKLVASMVSEIHKFSQGELNAFPLTTDSLRPMQAVGTGTYDFESRESPNYSYLETTLKALPPNTILLASYGFLTSDKSDQVYGDQVIERFFVPEFLRDVMEVDLVAADEAHFVKNDTAKITRAVHAIIAREGVVKIPMSGTLIVNSVADYVGLGALTNPALLRDTAEFYGRFGDDPDGPAVRELIKSQAGFVQVDKWEYAAFLSPLTQQYHFIPSIHPELKRFYDAFIVESLEAYLKSDPEAAKKMAASTPPDPNEDDDLDSALNAYFQSVELLLSAPDAKDANGKYIYDAFVRNVRDPRALVSPKVDKIAEICRVHFKKYFTDDILAQRKRYVQSLAAEGRAAQPMGNKIIVFSNRRATPQHIYDNLPKDLKPYAKLYLAEFGMGAIEEWKYNDNLRILIASENTIKEGQNFQMANRLIRVESGFRPGDQEEQAPGRVDRPDPDKVYDRDMVYIDWVLCDNTIEVLKAARVIHKIINKARADYGQDEAGRGGIPSFGKMVDGVIPGTPMVRLSMGNIQSPEMTSRSSMLDYFEAYTTYSKWKLFMREESAKTTPPAHEIRPVNRVTIPGSKRLAYTPRVVGMTPTSTTGFEVVSVAIREMPPPSSGGSAEDEEDSSNREENLEDIVAIEVGDIVDTEFGIGIVRRVLKNDLRVDIKGIPVPVKVSKATAWHFVNAEDRKKVAALIAKSKSMATLPGGAAAAPPVSKFAEDDAPPVKPTPTTTTKPAFLPPRRAATTGTGGKPPLPQTPAPAPKPPRSPYAGLAAAASRARKIKEAEARLLVETPEDTVTVSALNGCLALVYGVSDSSYVLDYGFKTLPPLARATFKTPAQLRAFRDALTAKPARRGDRGFTVSDDALALLDTTLRHWKQGVVSSTQSGVEPIDVVGYIERVFKKKTSSMSTVHFLLFVNLEDGSVSIGLNPAHKSTPAVRTLLPTLKFKVDGDGTLYRVGLKARLASMLKAMGPLMETSFKGELETLRLTKERD